MEIFISDTNKNVGLLSFKYISIDRAERYDI